MDKPKYCPTQNGSFTGYRPEYRMIDGDTKTDWKTLPTKRGLYSKGAPYPKDFGGILYTIGLCGYNQAKALAYDFAATAEETGASKIEVRAVAYEIFYDIKAERIEEVTE